MGYLCEAALMKFFISFCSYQAAFHRLSARGISNFVKAYFTSLAKEFVYRMLTWGFQIPLLVNLKMKSKYLAALQEVITSASTKYKSLKEEGSWFKKNNLLKSKNLGSVSFTQGEPADKHTITLQWAPQPPQDQTANKYIQRASQAETTITKYKGD